MNEHWNFLLFSENTHIKHQGNWLQSKCVLRILEIIPQPITMKSLEDSCIHCIMNHIQDIPNIRGKLPRIYKELLLTRLSEHNLLTPNILGCVNRELCVNSLLHLQLSHCSQVNDQFLKSFANTQSQLRTILIEKCDVSGQY